MTKFFPLRSNKYPYLTDDGNSDKKTKGTKKYVVKRKLKFNHYENCLLDNETKSKSQQRYKTETYNVYTEEINSISLSSNDDKRLQTFDRITSYSYGTSVAKVVKQSY